MELNYKLRRNFINILILLIIVTIIIYVFLTFVSRKKVLKFKPLTNDELDKLYKVDKKYYKLREQFQNYFIKDVNERQVLTANKKHLYCFINNTFFELKDLLKEYRINKIELDEEKLFMKYFSIYMNNNKAKYITNSCIYHKCDFINDINQIVYNKYKHVLNNYNNRKEIILPDLSFKQYIERLSLFLANYKHVERENKFINIFIRKQPFIITNQALFKRTLTFIWRLGTYIVYNLNQNNNVEYEIRIFNKYIFNIIDMCSIKEKGFPFKYDWFLFASYYPTILSYKLFIDYITKNTINFNLINEILKFIPKINYSRHILRFKSNVAIMSMSYIIAHLFKFHNDMETFKEFLDDVFQSDIFHDDIIIKYQEPNNNKFVDGLYFDGGFIIHKNLVSYNYLTAYLYPSLFYKHMFDVDTDNINKIFKAVHKMLIPNRKVNPVIISRYGKFNETDNVINSFLLHSNAFNIKYTEPFVLLYQEIQNGNIELVKGINIIESARIVIANFQTWSIQFKINCELAYGEVDIYNKQILKQISMSKIMFFDNIQLVEFKPHSLYPGVLSYKKYLNNAESFNIKYGTTTFTFDKVKYSYVKLDNNTAIIYSIIKNNEIKIAYEELIIITEIGIIVGYFNIERHFNDELYITLENEIINTYVDTKILYSDDETKPFEYNTALVKKVKNNILYYNKIKESQNINANVIINNENIKIDINIKTKYSIILDKTQGLYVQ